MIIKIRNTLKVVFPNQRLSQRGKAEIIRINHSTSEVL